MRILMIGASGTIGKRIIAQLPAGTDMITASRTSGDLQVDITQQESIQHLFEHLPPVDACVCTDASGPMDDFQTLTQAQLLTNMSAKLFGQVNLVLIGQHYLNSGGSFTLTSGIFADQPAKGVTGGSLISGGLHSFVLSSALELKRGLRINVVSSGIVEDSVDAFGSYFPTLVPVPMLHVVAAYRVSIETPITGQILRVYS